MSSYSLNNLLVQEPNVRFPPYIALYQLGLRKYDSTYFEERIDDITKKFEKKIENTDKTSKIARLRARKERKIERLEDKIKNGNNFMQWGEPLAIFDTANVEKSKFNLEQYLFNHGYFNGKVIVDIEKGKGLIEKRKNKKVKVTYQLKSGTPYRIDTFYYRSSDSTLNALLNGTLEQSEIITGDIYNQNKIIKERERVEFYLKDHGYYNFSRSYLSVQVDTTKNNNTASVRINVNNPSNGKHKVYSIDSVIFVINNNYSSREGNRPPPVNLNGITYSFYDNIYTEKVLGRRIFIRKDSLYSRSNTLNTQRRLANLDNFKFININYDSSGGQFVSYIFTSPLSRYQWSHELGLNVTQGFPGPFYNLNLLKRNVFGGLENFEINGRFGIEGVATPGDIQSLYRNQEFGINASLTFPQFVLPVGERFKDKIGKINPKTRFLAGYTDTDRFDYRRRNLNISDTYTWQSDENTFFTFVLADVSIINTIKLTDEFRNIIMEQNSRLINSFEPSFVSNTSFSFRKSTASNLIAPNSRSSSVRLSLESGGAALNFYGTEYLRSQNLEYFQYGRINIDYSESKPLTSFSSFAYRINMGMALPYGDNAALPYEKYLFAGGSNGIRAWRPRRLGPGSYTQIDENGFASYDREQQGEFLLQGSIEYRRDLFGLIDYALFLDAGNIWMVTNDERRAGSRFSNTFWQEIAIGTGFGLRFDFSFLVFRLDMGIKTYDPAREKGKRWIFTPEFYDPPYDNITRTERVVFNIAVGYPF